MDYFEWGCKALVRNSYIKCKKRPMCAKWIKNDEFKWHKGSYKCASVKNNARFFAAASNTGNFIMNKLIVESWTSYQISRQFWLKGDLKSILGNHSVVSEEIHAGNPLFTIRMLLVQVCQWQPTQWINNGKVPIYVKHDWLNEETGKSSRFLLISLKYLESH